MKVNYTGGIGALTAPLKKKLDARFIKLGKMLDGKGEKSAHVVITEQRHLQQAEIKVNFYGHPLVGIVKHADLFTAIYSAADKLERQLLKEKSKYRDSKRTPIGKSAPAPLAKVAKKAAAKAAAESPKPTAKAAKKAAAAAKPKPKVYKLNHREDRKPMTLEEAMMNAADGQDYVVYQDATTDRTSVLVRRPDGHFDLIES